MVKGTHLCSMIFLLFWFLIRILSLITLNRFLDVYCQQKYNSLIEFETYQSFYVSVR